MKKNLILSLFLLINVSTVFAQPDSEVFTTPDFVWCGLDFSQAKLIGAEGFSDPQDIKDRFFNAWNNLILTESDKYDLKKAYEKNNQITDLSVVNRRNEKPDADELVINEDYELPDGALKKIISDYNLEKANKGLGLVYVVESFNKTRTEGVMYVVFFDIASKKILWQSKYASKPGGFGVRNYWARSVLETIKSSGKDYEKSLRKLKKSS